MLYETVKIEDYNITKKVEEFPRDKITRRIYGYNGLCNGHIIDFKLEKEPTLKDYFYDSLKIIDKVKKHDLTRDVISAPVLVKTCKEFFVYDYYVCKLSYSISIGINPATFTATNPVSPVGVWNGGELVGIIMPITNICVGGNISA